MKRNLTTLILAFLATGAFAQSPMMHLPNSTSGISSAVNNRGVAIGPGFDKPLARLHLNDSKVNGTGLMIDIQSTQQFIQGGGSFYDFPDFFIDARSKDNALPGSTYRTRFSVDNQGKVQAGLSDPSILEQLAVSNNLAVYDGTSRWMKLDLTSLRAVFRWESPGRHLEFINEGNGTAALRLSDQGQIGVNTENFTNDHKLHVEGGSVSDYSAVQPVGDWNSGDNYLGMYFSDRPELRWNSNDSSYFEFKAADTGEVPLRLTSSGKVGINTDCFTGTHSLYIEGSAIAEEIFVQLKSAWCDYVFEDDYYLRPLVEVEDYIKDNGHLPNIPSAAEIEETGIPVGEMERLLTEKVEELTLYIIQMQKEIDTLKEQIKD